MRGVAPPLVTTPIYPLSKLPEPVNRSPRGGEDTSHMAHVQAALYPGESRDDIFRCQLVLVALNLPL